MRVLFGALGCEQLSIGLLAAVLRRSGHRVGLAFSRHLFDDRLFKRADRQHHVEEALDRLEPAGLEIKTDHIFGLPGEPKDAQQSALEKIGGGHASITMSKAGDPAQQVENAKRLARGLGGH
jgi:hypothetical protein